MTLRKSKLISFVATTNPPKAKKFYSETLGLRLVGEDPYALVFDAGGTMLRVAAVQVLQPAGYTVLGWTVRDIQSSVFDLVGKGVQFRRYEGMDQDEHGIWRSPSGARIAWFTDPDGNTLSLTEFERKAKTSRQPKPQRKPQRRARRPRRR
ncbi:MAG TPA: VOC family protein [Bacteroidota bacterium]|nr:VOC family protein [Bacteroidota bacterium]